VDYQRIFLENLNIIDRVVQVVLRRHGARPADREDFASFVRLRLMEDEYRILRRFEQRSSLSTYLTIVVTRLFTDYCNQQRGRWRPSREAIRLGPEATLMDRLVTRDGRTLDEAIQILRVNHRISLTENELRALWSRLPPRQVPTFVGQEVAATIPSDESTEEDRLACGEEASAILDALRGALASLPDEERVILLLHVGRDVPLAHIGRLTGQSIPTVHRRVRRALEVCRTALSSAGVDRERLRRAAGTGSASMSALLGALDRLLLAGGAEE
jgi:RNA polymerase sigma factor (sigma-70 family)